MATTMVVNGSWLPISNLIFALNRHAQYSYYYLAAAAGSVLLSYPLVKWLGSPGAAVSLLTLDCVMFARVWSGAMAMKVFDPKEVYETAVAEGARLRHSWSKFALRRSHDEPPALEPPSRDSGGAD
jgi:hypothetical protein